MISSTATPTTAATCRSAISCRRATTARSAYPLILFLHGAGERGSDNEAQLNNNANGAMRLLDDRQSRAAAGLHDRAAMPDRRLVERRHADQRDQSRRSDLATTYNIDPDRVYVTGLSMGGMGTWSAVTAQPDRFAAAVPMSGNGDTNPAGTRRGDSVLVLPRGRRRHGRRRGFGQSRRGAAQCRRQRRSTRATTPAATASGRSRTRIRCCSRGSSRRRAARRARSRRRSCASNRRPTSRLDDRGRDDRSRRHRESRTVCDRIGRLGSRRRHQRRGDRHDELERRRHCARVSGTNLIRVTATAPSLHDAYGGHTTFNDSLRVNRWARRRRPARSSPRSMPAAPRTRRPTARRTRPTRHSTAAARRFRTSISRNTDDDALYNDWRFGNFAYHVAGLSRRYASSSISPTPTTPRRASASSTSRSKARRCCRISTSSRRPARTRGRRTFDVNVADGVLDIALTNGSVGNARLDAFRVIRRASGDSLFADGFDGELSLVCQFFASGARRSRLLKARHFRLEAARDKAPWRAGYG